MNWNNGFLQHTPSTCEPCTFCNLSCIHTQHLSRRTSPQGIVLHEGRIRNQLYSSYIYRLTKSHLILNFSLSKQHDNIIWLLLYN